MNDRLSRLEDLLAERIVLLDGAMGTLLWTPGDTEPPDAANLDAPDRVAALHRAYLAAGADIVTTNTFGGAAPALHGPEGVRLAVARNFAGARLARMAADAAEREEPGRARFVAGSVGPIHRSATGDMPNFDSLVAAYRTAVRALIDGGADLVIAETLFDVASLDPFIAAVDAVRTELDHPVPLILSATATGGGSLPDGSTIDAFIRAAIRAAAPSAPVALGLNCGIGARSLTAPVARLATGAPVAVSVRPNAGMPHADGRHPDGPQVLATALAEMAEAGGVNIVGGCCGTTPEHIARLAARMQGVRPRRWDRRIL